MANRRADGSALADIYWKQPAESDPATSSKSLHDMSECRVKDSVLRDRLILISNTIRSLQSSTQLDSSPHSASDPPLPRSACHVTVQRKGALVQSGLDLATCPQLPEDWEVSTVRFSAPHSNSGPGAGSWTIETLYVDGDGRRHAFVKRGADEIAAYNTSIWVVKTINGGATVQGQTRLAVRYWYAPTDAEALETLKELHPAVSSELESKYKVWISGSSSGLRHEREPCSCVPRTNFLLTAARAGASAVRNDLGGNYAMQVSGINTTETALLQDPPLHPTPTSHLPDCDWGNGDTSIRPTRWSETA